MTPVEILHVCLRADLDKLRELDKTQPEAVTAIVGKR